MIHTGFVEEHEPNPHGGLISGSIKGIAQLRGMSWCTYKGKRCIRPSAAVGCNRNCSVQKPYVLFWTSPLDLTSTWPRNERTDSPSPTCRSISGTSSPMISELSLSLWLFTASGRRTRARVVLIPSLCAFDLDGRTMLFPTFLPIATWLRIRFLVALSMVDLLLSMNSNGISVVIQTGK